MNTTSCSIFKSKTKCRLCVEFLKSGNFRHCHYNHFEINKQIDNEINKNQVINLLTAVALTVTAVLCGTYENYWAISIVCQSVLFYFLTLKKVHYYDKFFSFEPRNSLIEDELND